MMLSTIPLRSWYSLMLVFFVCFNSNRPISFQEKYIEQFKFVAINEMQRSGIPASIKMAQGLLESQSGRSELATQANNHFGIKCKSSWTGNNYYHEDDDRDSSGEIIPSCFRSYSSAIDSYKDHSDFLMNRARYKELFNFSKTDYVSWAYGLKRCGYATDPSYAERLIKTIQKYNLDLLDIQTDAAEPLAIISNQTTNKGVQQNPIPEETLKPSLVSNVIKKNITKKKYKSGQKKKRKMRI
ncbi:MAG: glucosaminidase domain-containing protein [Saprospiraceae bacterium]